jgi:hypothetical protein
MNLNLEKLKPDQLEAALAKLEGEKARRAAENRLAASSIRRSSWIARCRPSTDRLKPGHRESDKRRVGQTSPYYFAFL